MNFKFISKIIYFNKNFNTKFFEIEAEKYQKKDYQKDS